MTDEYKFLNPYNFVRYLPELETNSKSIDHVLHSRCQPPPHDRYLALSGQIECEIQANSPLFVSDSEGIQNEVRRCKSYQFFKLSDSIIKENFAIPATSLKGMIRNVFEAATNSCFSVFEGGKLGRREPPINYKDGALPGRIVSIPTESSPGSVQCMEAYKLSHIQFNKYRNNFLENGKKISVKVDDEKKIVTHIGGEIEGYLKTSDKGIGKNGKRNEFVFIPTNPLKEIQLHYDVYWDYVISNRNNKQDHTKEPKIGDTIWFRLDSNQNIYTFGYSQIHRMPFDASINDLLPSFLHPCKKYEQLCPACRTFGWVHPNPSPDLDEKVAYAGRVNISHARLINTPILFKENPVILAILSAPKPTTERFYLLNRKGEPDSQVKYRIYSQLRGRKFYRIHADENLKNREYSRPNKNKDKNNRVLRDVLAPGVCFKFNLSFHNLTSLELGALLWAIQLEPGMCHKLGLGKPLGFGSVSITIKSMKLLDPNQRYSSFNENGWVNIKTDSRKALINQFKSALCTKYNEEFLSLLNIKDLRSILSIHEDKLPIHYPRIKEEVDPNGKNYEWFEQNKNQSLGLASSDPGLYPLKSDKSNTKHHPTNQKTKNKKNNTTSPELESYFDEIENFLKRSKAPDKNLSKLLQHLQRKGMESKNKGFKELGFKKFKEIVIAAIEANRLNYEINEGGIIDYRK